MRAAALLVAAWCAAGCGATGDARDAARPTPAAETVPVGLDVIWWVADDTTGAVGAALAEHVQPPFPEDSALREAWRASGMRLARVPIERLAEIERGVPAVGQRYRTPVGWSVEWKEVFRGRQVGGEAVLIAESRRIFSAGVMRLLARCWPLVGGGDATGRVHLEMAIQWEPAPSARTVDPFARPEAVPEDQRGEVLRGLTFSAAVEPGFAYILTTEEPSAEWTPRPPPTIEETGFSPPEGIEGSDSGKPKANGPALPRTPTLGEAMLGAPETESNRRRLKALVALLAHKPRGAVRLLP